MDNDQEQAPPAQDLPRENVKEADIAEEDILLGRGGKTNHHIGNARYLKIIEARQVEYMNIGSRTEKTEYAMKLVQKFRQEGSRFLKKDATTKLWNDVGDTKMREKVSQNLREHQPQLKKEQKEGGQQQQQQQQQFDTISPVTSRSAMNSSKVKGGPSVQQTFSPMNNNGNFMQQPMMAPATSGGGEGKFVSAVPAMNGSFNGSMNNMNNLSPHQMQMMQFQLQQQNAQMQAVLAQQEQQIQSQMLMKQQQMQSQMGSSGMNHAMNNATYNLQQPSLALPTMGTSPSMATVAACNISTMNNNTITNSMSTEPIPYNAGGVVIQADDNYLDPLPLTGNINRGEYETGSNGNNVSSSSKQDWGSSINTSEHGLTGLMGASLHSLPEESPITPTEAEEAAFRNQRAFSKQQDFADRDAGYQSSSTLEEDDDEFATDAATGGGPPPSRGSGVFFGSRRESYGDIDIAGAMGESTQSLLDSLRVDAVPEDQEYEDGEPLSPKPDMLQNADAGDEHYTPVTHNLNRTTFKKPLSAGDTATITPPALSPAPRNAEFLGNNVLDNDALDAWANTYVDHDDELEINPFVFNNGGVTSSSAAAPFRRHNTYDGSSNNTGSTAAAFRRTYTNPNPGRAASHFESSAGVPTARRTPRKAQTCPGRPQSPTGGELSPRPSALTMSKRGTSNVNETPETRGNLIFQEGSLEQEAEPDNTDSDAIYSRTSNSRIKKASLGRDTSARARALKEQYMPDVYGSPCGNSSSTISTATISGSSKSSISGWPASLPFPSSTATGGSAQLGSTSPITPKTGNGSNGLTREITPRTGKMLVDFGKLDLSVGVQSNTGSNRTNTTRTATTFNDTLDTGSSHETLVMADKNPMDLIVKKPDRLIWRNRTSTIEALDLESLEDDPVLKGDDEGARRPSRSSITELAKMWATMPAKDVNDIVSEVAGHRLSDFVGQPSK